MTYNQFNPHSTLKSYIDGFWTSKGDEGEINTEIIMPDGCIDIIINLGEDCKSEDNDITMKNGEAYLVGTMIRFKKIIMTEETNLLGIRFKPGAFSSFYKYSSLHEVTDQTVEFDKGYSPDIQKIVKDPTSYLNRFFLDKLSKPKHNLLEVIADIQKHKGQINLHALAAHHFTTTRQLERGFKKHIGVTPKEFINFVRYQSALSTIQNNSRNRSLLDIAFESGYYDHSHLTNEVKRYSGMTPSQL